MFKDYITIPEERIKLLKENKEFIEKVEKNLNVKMSFENNSVVIEGDDGLKIMRAKQIIAAFARGFSSEDSLLLLNENYVLEIINIKDYAKSRNRQFELKGRVIGEKGKAKRMIEDFTNTKLSIYGKTISIIGEYEDVEIAKRAVEMLLEGRMHSTVMRFLEIEKSKRKTFF